MKTCPIYLSSFTNGVYYYYAMQCPSTPVGLASATPLTPTNCTEMGPDCQSRLVQADELLKAITPARSALKHTRAFAFNGSLTLDGLPRPFDPASDKWLGQDVVLEFNAAVRLTSDGQLKPFRLWLVLTTPPAGYTPILSGIGQELRPDVPTTGRELRAVQVDKKNTKYWV